MTETTNTGETTIIKPFPCSTLPPPPKPNSSPPSPTPSAAASASDPHQCKSCREMSKMAHWELSCPSNNPSCVGTIITVQSSADSH